MALLFSLNDPFKEPRGTDNKGKPLDSSSEIAHLVTDHLRLQNKVKSLEKQLHDMGQGRSIRDTEEQFCRVGQGQCAGGANIVVGANTNTIVEQEEHTLDATEDDVQLLETDDDNNGFDDSFEGDVEQLKQTIRGLRNKLTGTRKESENRRKSILKIINTKRTLTKEYNKVAQDSQRWENLYHRALEDKQRSESNLLTVKQLVVTLQNERTQRARKKRKKINE